MGGAFTQEVDRIKLEHPDDNTCILNDRVKGRLKVTRAFGAGFLKKVLIWYHKRVVVKAVFSSLSCLFVKLFKGCNPPWT